MTLQSRNDICSSLSYGHLELDFPVFEKFKTFKNFSRKAEESFKTFIAKYERLKLEIEETVCSRSTKEQIEVFELLIVCNLDSDDVKSILNNTNSDLDYESVKGNIMEIADEIDKLELKVEEAKSDFNIKETKVEIEEFNIDNVCNEQGLDDVVHDESDISNDNSLSDQIHGDTKIIKFSKAENESDTPLPNEKGTLRPKKKTKEMRKQCKDCGKFVLRLKAHFRDVHLGIKVPCDVCGKQIIESHLWKHMRIHKTTEIKCDECNYVTINNERLQLHIKNMHKPKEFACDICGSQYGTKICLRNHMNTVHNSKSIKCLHCDFQTTNSKSMNRHVIDRHKKPANFVCAFCNFEFADRESLSSHLLDVHGGDGMAPKLQMKSKRNYDCDLCDYKGGGKNALRLHKNSKHLGIRHNCDQCEYSTTQKPILEAHKRRVHLGITYPCSFCGLKCANKNSLKAHMINKHPNDFQLFSCHLCSYRTQSKDLLQRHISGKYGKHNS